MDGAEFRKIERKHVLWSATVISPDGARHARIRNLSSSGVQIICDNPPTSDCDVIFKRGAVFAAARVAWTDKTSAGLEFYRHLKPSDLGAELPTVRVRNLGKASVRKGSIPRTPYRLFFFDGARHIDKAHEFEADDDDDAITIAEAWREGRAMELWQRDRRVKRWDGSSL